MLLAAAQLGRDKSDSLLWHLRSSQNFQPWQEADPGSREGYLGLFVYLPVAMGNAFERLGSKWFFEAQSVSFLNLPAHA